LTMLQRAPLDLRYTGKLAFCIDANPHTNPSQVPLKLFGKVERITFDHEWEMRSFLKYSLLYTKDGVKQNYFCHNCLENYTESEWA